MREIKFRAKMEGEWRYYTLGDLIVGDARYDSRTKKFIAGTWSQFTGLKDKKGREIYEGDIVNAKYVYIKEKPVYGGETGEFIGVKDEEKEIKKTFVVKWHLGAFNLIPDKAIHWEFEIIGNIYENPELLERDNAV